MSIHISLAAEEVFRVYGLSVSNSMLTAWIVSAFLISIAFIVRIRLSLVPNTLQVLAEGLVGGIYTLFESIVGHRIKQFFPLLGSLFIFIVFANWIGLLPGVGTIGFYKMEHQEKIFIPLFRAATADLNTTFALALIAVLSLQFYGVRALGLWEYLKRYLNFSNPIYFFVGFLELIQEFARVLSFAFRLFGNIFAGEVLLAVMAFLVPLLVPVPFLAMEVFVGFIQALVFSMLTAVFLSLATQKVEH